MQTEVDIRNYDPMAERTRIAPCKVLRAWFDSKLGSPNARRAARLMPIPSTFDDEVLSESPADVGSEEAARRLEPVATTSRRSRKHPPFWNGPK
jgi:hypothetical protein